MATAKRLPSGSYRVRVYSHSEDGKKVYESFTAPTKREAEMMAIQFQKGTEKVKSITVKDAVKEYIKANTGILSPATLYGYECELKRMVSIGNLKIDKIRTHDVQLFISELSKKYSPKTVKNTYGLLYASIAHFNPDIHFRVNLPKQRKKRLNSPSNEDVETLFNAASPKLKNCIALAAFHSLRRGEIAALKYSDLEGNKIHIHADIIYSRSQGWVYKEYPKTDDSDRIVAIPVQFVEMLGQGNPDEYIINWKPNSITKRFEELCKKLDINIRFHDLRHYFASIGAIIGIPDIYLASMGGWKPDGTVMKSIYQNKLISMEQVYNDKMNEHFSKMYDTKYDTQNKKAAK